MWYVIQITTGKEEHIVTQCRNTIGECDDENAVLQKCFIPYTRRQRRYQGQWHTEQKTLFPGYVFLVSGQPEELFLRLKRVYGLTKLLRCGQEIVPLSEGEVAFLKRLGGDGQIVEPSIGFVEQEQIIITDGPLRGLEGCIRRIDRHKRVAWLEIEMMGRTMEAQVGLEVVEKR